MTIEEFAEKVTQGYQESSRRAHMDCEANLKENIAHIHRGRKWTRVDVGSSGKFMINPNGDIYGIKAYGVPHLGHYYGTLANPLSTAFVGLWG